MLAYVLGGHVAELIIFGEVTTGASNDIERVTKIARSMVTEYGMSSRIGPMALGHKEELVFLGRDFGEQRNYSEQTHAKSMKRYVVLSRKHSIKRIVCCYRTRLA